MPWKTTRRERAWESDQLEARRHWEHNIRVPYAMHSRRGLKVNPH